MRQFFTLLVACVFCTNMQSTAQVILKENFEAVTKPALPTGWTQITKAATGWKTHSGTVNTTNGWTILPHTNYAVIDEWNNNEDNDTTILVSPIFSLVGKSKAILKYDLWFIKATYNDNITTQDGYVTISTDSGKTWTQIDTMTGDGLSWESQVVDLAAYDTADTVQIAFVFNEKGEKTLPLLGCAIDNILVFEQLANDVAVTGLTLPYLYDTAYGGVDGTPVIVTIENNGSATLSDFELQYSLNGGTPVVETFSGFNLAPFKTETVVFTTKLSGVVKGSYNALVITATKANGVTDSNAANNVLTGGFMGVSSSVARACLIEDFTSATHSAAAKYHEKFDPIILENNVNKTASNFNIIRYHMNWGGSYDDPSFNDHCSTRNFYYELGPRLPLHYVHGKERKLHISNEYGIEVCKDGISFVKAEGTYFTTSDSARIDVTFTPYFSVTRNYRIHVVLLDNDFWYGASSGQEHFYYGMRKMYPDGEGKQIGSFAANQAINVKYESKLKRGNVEQFSENLWSYPINTTIVAFIQDEVSKDILQSIAIPAQWPTGVENTSSAITRLSIYPNPAMDKTNIGINLDKATTVDIQVTDIVGRVLFTSSQQLVAGAHELPISTANFANGSYNVTIKAENAHIVKHLSVIR